MLRQVGAQLRFRHYGWVFHLITALDNVPVALCAPRPLARDWSPHVALAGGVIASSMGGRTSWLTIFNCPLLRDTPFPTPCPMVHFCPGRQQDGLMHCGFRLRL